MCLEELPTKEFRGILQFCTPPTFPNYSNVDVWNKRNTKQYGGGVVLWYHGSVLG